MNHTLGKKMNDQKDAGYLVFHLLPDRAIFKPTAVVIVTLVQLMSWKLTFSEAAGWGRALPLCRKRLGWAG
jgi:hypothetical protein